jgi:hypothetical protein
MLVLEQWYALVCLMKESMGDHDDDSQTDSVRMEIVAAGAMFVHSV